MRPLFTGRVRTDVSACTISSDIDSNEKSLDVDKTCEAQERSGVMRNVVFYVT